MAPEPREGRATSRYVISIRRATAVDHEVINAIVQGSSAYDGVYRAMLDGYEVPLSQVVQEETWLATDGADALGFYSLVLEPEPELDLMFVADSEQGRGVGRLLFEHMRALAKARGVAAVKIVSHPPARDFYRRMGAIEVGLAYPARNVTWVRPILSLPV
ncbi:MAG: GNAT family N-acetyltransferase [Hyphomonadaceae bacterium]|nr:MAG: acetyltransferase [Caulobacteraceae bacterium]MBT9444456.1 GNAT family N-acetyltransferase [Hyphomonadaceae bacterium]TPW07101.1 MAG: acetyltransferase [Alphaproteobacteria bacterium]